MLNIFSNLFRNAKIVSKLHLFLIKRKDLEIRTSKNLLKKPKFDSNIKFGQYLTDHMLEVNWTLEEGWEKPVIKPTENLSVHPSASTFHYGVHLFEGAKAFKNPNGEPIMFRTELNMNRMRYSSEKISLPDFDSTELLECIKELVSIEKDWIHEKKGYSLYIRPTHIGTMPILGVKASTKSKIFVILSPVGPYFETGFAPINLYCEDKQVRAAPFGTGCYKIGGNYGPTIPVSTMAEKLGCSQVLWLYKGLVTEIGSSNIFMVWKNKEGETELITHPADDLILHGVTRDSVIVRLFCNSSENCPRQWNKSK